jgi:heme/copper-type cytochrome/quinol oxidase subunit 2
VNHGFSLFPVNVNFQIIPGYDYALRVTPTASGDFRIICNEFCGIGHHTMVGRVIVVDANGKTVADNGRAAVKSGDHAMSAPALSASRTCPATGRTIHLSAERLVKWNAVVAIVRCWSGPSPRCCWC